jgi:antitoxin (DNA-binding transcriptional repressor) of toxin-antitoxin stability system
VQIRVVPAGFWPRSRRSWPKPSRAARLGSPGRATVVRCRTMCLAPRDRTAAVIAAVRVGERVTLTRGEPVADFVRMLSAIAPAGWGGKAAPHPARGAGEHLPASRSSPRSRRTRQTGDRDLPQSSRRARIGSRTGSTLARRRLSARDGEPSRGIARRLDRDCQRPAASVRPIISRRVSGGSLPPRLRTVNFALPIAEPRPLGQGRTPTPPESSCVKLTLR